MEGTHAHIWWQCPLIQVYWREILGLVKKISGYEIRYDPWECLFHTTSMSRKKYRGSLVPFLLNGAKALIPRNWREKRAPSTGEWLQEIDRIKVMEELWAFHVEDGPRFEAIWKGWRDFRTRGCEEGEEGGGRRGD